MSENKITTNRIEEVLLNKEKDKFIKEVESAVQNLVNILNEYLPDTHKKEELEAYQGWATEIIEVSYRVFPQYKKIENLPEYIERNLLQNAVDKFIKSVEETKATLESLDC
jgi:hypothetical protein